MNHRPFEDWLLEETHLTPEQARNLQAHVRTCKSCTALMEVGTALQRVKQVAPATGFNTRFQSRLAARKVEQRRRNVVGLVLLVVGGLSVLAWMASPFVAATMQSPGNFFVSWFTSVLMFLTTLQAYSQIGGIFFKALAGIVPIFIWMVVGSAFAGLLLVWSFTFWKSTTLTARA